jgi:hypothetical protein
VGAVAVSGRKIVAETREAPRWCFGCRKRLGGTHKLYDDTSGYLGPFWQYHCDGCNGDRRWMHGPL